ncbi:hypothetical protein M8818_002693 [Zalaria obscura]|uniref:Uncharacterized protein n=1 Tax=Zalaria obscura TaxID=2024903 RepID=A0ACC3SJR5_9PEZI
MDCSGGKRTRKEGSVKICNSKREPFDRRPGVGSFETGRPGRSGISTDAADAPERNTETIRSASIVDIPTEVNISDSCLPEGKAELCHLCGE